MIHTLFFCDHSIGFYHLWHIFLYHVVLDSYFYSQMRNFWNLKTVHFDLTNRCCFSSLLILEESSVLLMLHNDAVSIHSIKLNIILKFLIQITRKSSIKIPAYSYFFTTFYLIHQFCATEPITIEAVAKR